MVVHVAIVIAAWRGCEHEERRPEIVDIELAPEAPEVEALPEEVARAPVEDKPSKPVKEEQLDTTKVPETPDEGYAVDAGVDAPPDAPPDAKPDARPDAAPDAPPDATPDAETVIAQVDAGVEDAVQAAVEVDAASASPADAEVIATADAGVDAVEDAPAVAAVDPWGDNGEGSGSNAGSGEGSGSGSGGSGQEVGSGSGVPGTNNDPAVAGAPTTAGTAANLLAYFPAGHEVTALIRFDRLRGTEWAAQTERLLRPMPDYRVLFGPKDAKIYEKLGTLVISTPSPRDATATTLVGHTHLRRAALRDFLSAATPIAWSTSKGGLLGKRTGRVFPGDRRLFLSPYEGWFLLAQPSDLGGLTAAAPGSLDTVQASGKLPAWLAGVRTIEKESGDTRGPALVVTMALDGSKLPTGPLEPALGVAEVQLPERVSLAMELVSQGWLVRGNIRFKDEAAATAFVSQLQTVQNRIVGAAAIYGKVIGDAAVNVIKKLKFTRTGPRVSYTTSISIADTRAIMAVAAAQLDTYYKAPP